MKNLLSFLASRWSLAIVFLILFALGVWFLGPYVDFGGLRPLEGAVVRAVLIALISCAMLLWLKGWSTAIVFGALICLLIWYAAPLLSFGETKPFTSTDTRIVAIALVAAAFAGWGLFQVWKRMRSDEEFLRKTLAFDKKPQSLAAAQLGELDTRMNTALAQLKGMRTGARGFARWLQGTRYLYELPWYITLGSAGSGKTNAVLNCGLPLPASPVRSRSGPTSSVEWLLTNEAVFVDTAGYYTQPGTSTHVLEPQVHPQPGTADTTRAQPAFATTNRPALDEASHRRSVDTDEWSGFLTMLRKRRPHMPINGALLTLSLAVLTHPEASVRESEGEMLRERLAELRQSLGIRFPIYFIVTQMDRLDGFADYFASLTEESRGQIWGFTLPQSAPGLQCAAELDQLAARLRAGLNTRLYEEYDADRRRKLAALPDAFTALAAPLAALLAQIFVESRYDNTERDAMLRGVFFTSAAQGGSQLIAEPLTIIHRFTSGLKRLPSTEAGAPRKNHSYFLRDLFAKVVLPEAHLARPNLRWEFRSRLLRLTGHTFALLAFIWLAFALHGSFVNNSDYLQVIARKTQALSAKITQLYRNSRPEAVPDALSDSLNLPTWSGLDLAGPHADFRYGLYTAPGVISASNDTYNVLEENLLLPQIVRRMEEVMEQSIEAGDSRATYDALRVYLMLYDRARFNGAEIKAWLYNNWTSTGGLSEPGDRTEIFAHVEHLFSGERVVQSQLFRNDALIERARTLLNTSDSAQRLYERAKVAMQPDAPDDFSLLRVVGSQAGAVFTRASGAPLSRGVPGLFTLDGYRNVFDKRLREFVKTAREDDGWVMGHAYPLNWSDNAQKKTAEIASAATGTDDALTDAIRRLYLLEYAQSWKDFLEDIRPVSGSSLEFTLQVLRQLAAPDSPLVRLAQAAVRQTTLTQHIQNTGSMLLDETKRRIAGTATLFGTRPHERLERELVDDRFAALREMVTGSTKAQEDGAAPAPQTGAIRTDALTGLLYESYAALTVASNALVNNGFPPASDASAKLRMAANTLPAPFRNVLLEISAQASHQVNQGIGQLLSRQTEAVVGDACRLAVEGNFPFAPESKREISIEDFTRVFSQGGLLNDFFTKNLAPFVDTSSQKWRYKTLPGESVPVQGPDLEPFQHASAIQNVFFGDQGRQLAWKAELRVPELDPTIMSLAIDIDGQSMLYQHGPVTPLKISWPGPRGGAHVEIKASPGIRPDTSTIAIDGPWALIHLIQKGKVEETATPGRTRVVFDFDGRKAVLDIASMGSVANPLTSDVLTTFHCPRSMPMPGLPDSGPPPGLPPAGGTFMQTAH